MKGQGMITKIVDSISESFEREYQRTLRRFRAQDYVKNALEVKRDVVHVGNTTLRGIHGRDTCAGPSCWIHRPTQHHMRDWPVNWRIDRHMLERVCEHGTGHPDPDQPLADDTHGCCGCCFGAPYTESLLSPYLTSGSEHQIV